MAMPTHLPGRTRSSNPRWGIFIPSPFPTHTHAVACHPFSPNALLTVEGRLRYLPEHAIASFPIEQQGEHNAGQVVVVREMARLRKVEVEAKRLAAFPEIELNVTGNAAVKPLAEVAFWRKTLGWDGSEGVNARMQFNRYTTVFPGKGRLLKGVQERSVWDHQIGEWRATTHSAAQEAKERREWVYAELERIGVLRYRVMKEWKENTHEGYMAGRSIEIAEKRKRGQDGGDEVEVTTQTLMSRQENESDGEGNDDETDFFKRPQLSISIGGDRAAKRPRVSIEPSFEFPDAEPRLLDSQTTLSSLSTSPDCDIDHDIRSQAPEPESPSKTAFLISLKTIESMRRYSFVLDIPTTDNQRVQWLKFLDKYEWDPIMISELRRFFCADPTPNTSMTKRFLERLSEEAGGVKAEAEGEEMGEEGAEGSERYKLLWEKKVKMLVDEVAVLATPVREEIVVERRVGRILRGRQQEKIQPSWVRTPSVSPISSGYSPMQGQVSGLEGLPLATSRVKARVKMLGLPMAKKQRKGKGKGKEKGKGRADSGNDGKGGGNGVEEKDGIDIPALMKRYVATLKKGDRVEVPCDKCRVLNLECRINSSSCRRCAKRHDRCIWTMAEAQELRELGLLQVGVEEGEKRAEEGLTYKGDDETDKEDEVCKSGRKRGPLRADSGAGFTKASRGRSERSSETGSYAPDGGRRVRRKSVFDFPEDGDQTRWFLEDEGCLDYNDGGSNVGDNEAPGAIDDGHEMQAFVDYDGESDEYDDGEPVSTDSTEEEGDEYVPSLGE